MLSLETKLYSNFISEEERIALRDHAIYLLQTNVLEPNYVGPNRFAHFFHSLNDLAELHREIYYRVVSALELKTPIIDPMLGMVISIIKPSGFIHLHTDAYKDNIEKYPHVKNYLDKRNFRFNVMVQRDEDISYSPHIANKPLQVNERDAWCFAASELEHYTPPINGSKYRIVYQFGFAV